MHKNKKLGEYHFVQGTFWKLVKLSDSEDQLVSIFHNHTWEPGWNKADRNKVSKNGVLRGIHVYTTLEAARNNSDGGNFNRFRQSTDRIVPVLCNSSDIVSFDISESEAIFHKVFLNKDEYENALTRDSEEKVE